MSGILIAGVGNIFFSDDGFGVEVVRALERELILPDDVQVVDFGIRGIHLAYELLEPWDFVVITDCTMHGEEPGTLYLVDPATTPSREAIAEQGHGMNVVDVLSTLDHMGGTLPPMRIVGCEPESFAAGVGLSAAVSHAVPRAVAMIREQIARFMAGRNAQRDRARRTSEPSLSSSSSTLRRTANDKLR